MPKAPYAPLTIPPPNQHEARQRFWEEMAQHFAAAEQPHPAVLGPRWKQPEWRWPDIAGAKQVMREGYNMPGQEDAGDAIRHAETARRLSEKLGPALTELLGSVREYGELGGWAPWGALLMDLHNNHAGAQAYREGRAVHPGDLQTVPGSDHRRFGVYPSR